MDKSKQPSSRAGTPPAGEKAAGWQQEICDQTATQPKADACGRYQIVKELGRGGMGVVYQANDTQLQRQVALKIIGQAASGDKERKRFIREAHLMARLSHPDIVKIYDVGEHQGRLFIAMELLAGQSLDKLFADNVSLTQLVRILSRVANAVHYAHQQGVVHRDIKPSNIMVNNLNEPKVMDFGLAKEVNKSEYGVSKSMDILGTPEYMSPEQAQGKVRHIDAQSDVYALGIILYEAITGKTPFHASNPMAVLYQIGFEEPKPPSKLSPHVSRDLEAICLKAIEKDKSKRYQSAAAFADDLGRYIEGKPVTAQPVTALVRMGKWMRRHRIATVAGMAACFLLVFGTAYFFYRERDLRQRETSLRQDAEIQRQDAEAKALDALLNVTLGELMQAKGPIEQQDFFLAYDHYQKATSCFEKIKPGAVPVSLQERYALLQKIAKDMHRCCLAQNPHRTKNLRLQANDGAGMLCEDAGVAGNKGIAWGNWREALAQFSSQHLAVQLPVDKWDFVVPQSPAWDYLLRFPHHPELTAKTLQYWDVAQGQNTTTVGEPFDTYRNSKFALSEEQQLLAIGCPNGEVKVYEIATGKAVATTQFEAEKETKTESAAIKAMQFSRDCRYLCVATRHKLVLLQLPNLKTVVTYRNGGANPCLAFSRNSRWMAASGFDGVTGFMTCVWELADLAKEPKRLKYRGSALCFGPQDETLLIGMGRDIVVCRFASEDKDNTVLSGIHHGDVLAMAVSDDGSLMASLGMDSKLALHNTYNYKPMCKFIWQGDGSEGRVRMAFHPADKLLGVWSEKYVNIYRWQQNIKQEVAGHQVNKILAAAQHFSRLQALINANDLGNIVALHPQADGFVLMLNKTAMVYGYSNDRVVRIEPPGFESECKSVAFSPDGKWIGWWQAEHFVVWDTANNRTVKTIPLAMDGSRAQQLTFQPGTACVVGHVCNGRPSHVLFWNIDRTATISAHKIPVDTWHILNRVFDASGQSMALLIHNGDHIQVRQLNEPEDRQPAPFMLATDNRDNKQLCFGANTHLAIGSMSGEFMVYDWKKPQHPVTHARLFNPIRRIWYDQRYQMYWIWTSSALFIYPDVPDRATNELANLIYPLPIYAGYPILACDLSADCRHLLLMLQSGQFLLIRLDEQQATGEKR